MCGNKAKMALERELHNAECPDSRMSIASRRTRTICRWLFAATWSWLLPAHALTRWYVGLLLLGSSFGLAPIFTASMGHAFGYSRVFTAAVWFCMTFFALPLDSPPAVRTTLSHGYSRMYIAAV